VKKLVILAILTTNINAYSASEKQFFVKNAKGVLVQVSKRDTMRQLLTNPKSEVLRCNAVELSEKVTIRNK